MSSLIDKTRSSTLYVVPLQVVAKVIGLLYVIVLARNLSVEDYGIYNFLIGSILVFSYFCNFGLGSSLQRFLPEYSKLGQSARILKTILFSHAFRIALSVITLSVAAVWYVNWAKYFNVENNYIEFYIFAIGVVFLYQIEFFQIEFNALFMHGVSSIGQTLYSLLKLALVYVIFKMGMELSGVLIAEAVSYFIGVLFFTYVFASRVYPKLASKVCDSDGHIEFKRIGRYSGINALVIPGGILYSHSMDYFVVAAMASPYQLGIYALASRTSKMLMSILPHSMLQGVIRPAFYHRYYSVDDKNAELSSLFNAVVKLTALFLFPAVVLVGVAAEPIITTIFGEKYSEASDIFLMFLVFNVFTILEVSSDLVLQAIEKVQARLYAQVFAIYNVVSAIILINYFGVIGAAFATGSALMCKCLFFYYMARKYTGVRICWGSLIRITINSILSAFIAKYIMSFGDSSVILILAIIAGFFSYVGLSFINNFMSNDEKKLANKFIRRRLFNV